MSEFSVIEECRRPDGSINWNQLAKLTRYAVSVEVLQPQTALTTAVEQGILQDKLPETVAAEKLKNATEVQTIYF